MASVNSHTPLFFRRPRLRTHLSAQVVAHDIASKVKKLAFSFVTHYRGMIRSNDKSGRQAKMTRRNTMQWQRDADRELRHPSLIKLRNYVRKYVLWQNINRFQPAELGATAHGVLIFDDQLLKTEQSG